MAFGLVNWPSAKRVDGGLLGWDAVRADLAAPNQCAFIRLKA